MWRSLSWLMCSMLIQIENAPYNYQDQVERITLLRKCGEYDQLLTARKSMADIFPLTQVKLCL